MSDFYSKTFGWKAQIMGPEMGEYVVMTTTEMGENKLPKESGRINGGFFKKSGDNGIPSFVIAVEDINIAAEKIKAAGGKVLGGHKGDGTPDMIPGVGLYSSFIDTEGNRVSILQPDEMMEVSPK
jgi:predicted enzyme related to lactoylglutathione lyase